MNYKAIKIRRSIVCSVISLSVITLGVNFTVPASTVDDIRELSGGERVFKTFTQEEQSKIIKEYTKINSHNNLAKIFEENKNMDINEKIEKKSMYYESQINEVKKEYINKFSSGAYIDEVLNSKTVLDTLIYKKELLKEKGEDIEMAILPNPWEKQYIELKKALSKENTFRDIGEVGINLVPPTSGYFSILSPYGMRFDRKTKIPSMNYGIDFKAPEDTLVLSQWDGVVGRVYKEDTVGVIIEIQHDEGLNTKYTNLKQAYVKVGDKVSQYTTIGQVGKIDKSYESYLHFEVLLDGKAINPIYLYGTKGLKVLKAWVSNTQGVLFDGNKTNIEVKDMPKGIEEKIEVDVEKKRKKALGGADYTKEGTVPSGSVKLVLPDKYEKPNPTGLRRW